MIGCYLVAADASLSPRLRRGNRIRTIHASLAIENNTLTLEQVTAVLDGKRVLYLPREIQAVRKAFAAYEHIDRQVPTLQNDLLAAHGVLIAGLVDRAGEFRRGGWVYFTGLIERTQPESPRNPTQRYRLTEKGQAVIVERKAE